MKFSFIHNNINVFDLNKSISFYKKSLNMVESSRVEAEDGSFVLVYMKPEEGTNLIELTYLRDQNKPYNLGDNEIHMAFEVDDYAKAYELHKEMDVIVFENTVMGLYFIADPDGYWIEILEKGRN
ncbi:VOC family protein [Mycoplasma sp. P36-A1]|uniref:VOC family protein n=1 Tax=Mycoplasma sp. P36-A1 TaxID=3252900 RepID=UPI003C2E0F18